MADQTTVIVKPTVEDAVAVAAEALSDIAAEAVQQRGQFTLALAGGTTPRPLYEYLSYPPRVDDVPWQHTAVFFSDERDVPQDHADSNYRLAEQDLLGRVPIQLEHVYPMPADAPDLPLAADRYAETIIDKVPAEDDGPPRFDLILLGVGRDGHTASLFPDTPALGETEKLVVAQHVPVLNRYRMTFTFPLINAARNVMMLVTGLDKAEVLSRVLPPDRDASLPTGRVAPDSGELIFVLDAQAASRSGHRM